MLLQKQYLKATQSNPTGVNNMNAGATIKIEQEDGTLIDTYTIASNSTQSYCERIVDHVNFEFLATGTKVYITVDIVNDGQNPNGYNGNTEYKYRYLYQSAEVDNVQLEIASAAKLAFYYNDRGQRVRKESYIGSEVVQTIYVRDVAGSPMGIYYKLGHAAMQLTENPIYGASRIGVLNRSLNASNNTYVYQLADHLGNVRAVIAKEGNNAVALTQKTDYYPFGIPMPNRNVEGNYRYGYQGEFAEKEPELGGGINSFQLRLYDSRIGRWTSPDPMGEFHSPYLAMGNNPISLTDPTGGCTDCPEPSWGANINYDSGGARSYAGDNWHMGGMLDEVFISNNLTRELSNVSGTFAVAGLAANEANRRFGGQIEKFLNNKVHVTELAPIKVEDIIDFRQQDFDEYLKAAQRQKNLRIVNTQGRSAMKTLGRAVKGTGYVLGGVGMIFSYSDYMEGKIPGELLALDGVMTIVGFTGVGTPFAFIYFAARAGAFSDGNYYLPNSKGVIEGYKIRIDNSRVHNVNHSKLIKQ